MPSHAGLPIAGCDSFVALQLEQQPATDGPTTDQIRMEFRREVFRWAADKVQIEFSTSSWNAFWLTAVEDQDAADVAKQLDLSCGAVYTARSRVMKRLKEKVLEFQSDT